MPDALTPQDYWLADEQLDGQLAVDVYETPKTIVIRSAVAGVSPDDIQITVNREVVTIRGKRQKAELPADHVMLFQECYWGGFSRTIFLPVEVDADAVDASMTNGILSVTLPKVRSTGSRTIKVERRPS